MSAYPQSRMVVRRPLEVDIEAIDLAIESGHTLPTSFYSDPDIFDIEMDEVFARCWHMACPVAKVSQPGDHVPVMVGRVPVVVVRDKDGILRAFLNICRHRAFAVATEAGNRSTLQCAYHAWTYGLDGSLRAAPRCDAEPDFEKGDYGLLPVSVDEFCGFVFVNPDTDAAPMRDTYPNIDEVARRWDVDFSRYRYVDSWKFDVPVNWKAWVENSTECYHCPTIHANTFSSAFETRERGDEGYRYVNDGPFMIQGTAYKQTSQWGDAPTGGPEQGAGFRVLHFFPCSQLTIDDYVAMANRYVPVAPDRTESHVDVYVRPDLDEKFLAEWMEMHKATLDEDVVAMAAQQPGLNAHQLAAGRLLSNAESPISQFHKLLWADLRDALAPLATTRA